MVEEAARLAMSVLSRASALDPIVCQKALNQCKEQGQQMLENACNTVEMAAITGIWDMA